MFTERTQVLLSPEQLERVKRIAKRDGCSVGAVIRDAIDAYSWTPADRRRRAIDHMMTLEAPVEDWEVMKARIIAAATPPLPE